MPKIGHIKVKAARNAYHVMEHVGNNSYKKIATLYKFADTLPYRNVKWMKHNGALKYRDFPDPKEKVKAPIKSRNIAPRKQKKVVKTQSASIAASDKALQRIERTDKLVIKEKERPQKVAVQLDSKTIVMVYPEMLEHAKERYRQRHKQSQQQPCHTARQSPNKGKKKEPQSDLIFFH